MVLRYPAPDEFEIFGEESPSELWPLEHRILFDYWKSIHIGNFLPGRQHFDPLAVPKILKNLLLIDVAGPPFRFKFRVVGTHLVEVAGYDLTGKFFDNTYSDPEALARATHRLVRLVTERTVVRSKQRLQYFPRKDYIYYHALHLPLAQDGETVDMIVSVAVFSFADGQTL